MTLAQVQAAIGIFLILIASLTALMTTVAVLLPTQTGKASRTLEAKPGRCFITGLGLLIVLIISIRCIQLPFPLLKLISFVTQLGLAALATMGGAGMAQLMGERVGEMSGARTTFGSLVRGSLAFSMGACFPYVGWFLLAPLSLICAMGAGLTAVRPINVKNTAPQGLGSQGAM